MSAAFVKQALVLVAVALAGLRGLVAPGLMIVASPIDGVRVMLCSAHGADELFVLTPDGELIPERELPAGDSLDKLCPYGAAPQVCGVSGGRNHRPRSRRAAAAGAGAARFPLRLCRSARRCRADLRCST